MGEKDELLRVLADFIDRASRIPDEGPVMIFLDEVSSLKGWQEAYRKVSIYEADAIQIISAKTVGAEEFCTGDKKLHKIVIKERLNSIYLD